MCGKGMQQTSQQMAIPNMAAMAAYNRAMGKIDEATSKPFQRYSSDPEAYVASLNPVQRQAIANVSSMRGMTDPYYGAAAGLLGEAAERTGAAAAPVGRLTSSQIQEYMNPYMSQVVDPVRAGLQQQFGQQASQQQAEAIRSGAFGGSRSDVARALLRGQQGLALGQALSPLYQTGYGQALQTAQGQQAIEAQNLARALGAAGQIGQLGTAAGALGSAAQQAALQQANAQLQAGLLEQQTSTAQKQALYGEAQKERMYPLQTAQLYAQAAGSLGPLMGSTSQTYQQLPFFGGLMADGGAVDRYGEGLGQARMGGAVIDMEHGRDYWRGGYAGGGDIADIAAQQRAALGAGRPQEDIPFPTGEFRTGEAPKLGALPERREGIMGRLAGAVMSDPSAAYEKAKGLYSSGRDILQREGYLSNPLGGTHTGSGHFADGGEVSDPGMSQLLNSPIQVSRPLKAEAPEQRKSGGLGSLIKAGAGLAANAFLPGSGALVNAGLGALGMADGGRAGYQYGGSSEDDIGYYLKPLARVETGGERDPYGALGPVTKRGDRAYGKYQVMGANIPSWTKEVLGRAMTPQEFLADRNAQEQTARHKFGQYLDKSGTPEGAAAMWFGGPGYQKHAGARDILGTSIPEYQARYKAGLGGPDLAALGPRERSFEASYKGAPESRPRPAEDGGFTEHPERLIVPILSGLGAMAGSKSKYLGSAILEGLGAGAKSYMDVGSTLEEQRKVHQEADEARARGLFAGAEAMKTAGQLPIWADPTTGQRLILTSTGVPMDLQEYLQSPVPIMGGTAAAEIARQLGLQAAGGAQAGYAPEGGVMPTGVTSGAQAGVEGPSAAGAAREIAGQPREGAPAGPIVPKPKPIEYVGVNLGAAAQSAPAQERALVGTIGGREALASSQEIKQQINQAGRTARSQALYNAQAAQIIAEAAAAEGFEAMGEGSEARARVVGALNTIARGAGLGDSYFGANESRQQMLDKLNAIKGESTVISGGQKALGTLEKVIGAMPGTGQTVRSGTFNAASNLVQNQRLIDYQNYANAYGQRTSNLYNNVEEAFDSDNSRDRYAKEEEAFENIMKDPKGARMLSHLIKGERLDGSKASRQDIDNFFMNNFELPGMSRYFMGARRG